MDTDLIELESDGSRTLHSRATTPVTAPASVNGEFDHDQPPNIDLTDLDARLRELETRLRILEAARNVNQDERDAVVGNDDTVRTAPSRLLSWDYAIPLAALGLWFCIGMRFVFEAY
jgi:hypothetical protein